MREFRLFIIALTTVASVLFLSGLSIAGDKVRLCHYPPGNPENWHLIMVSENSMAAHLAHGDMVPMILYEDADGDFFGNPDVTSETCEFSDGFVDDNTDCDDTNPDINPGMVEIPADDTDNDCDPDTSGELFMFSGVLTEVPKSSLPGWNVCYQDTYNNVLDLVDIMAHCTRTNIMLACGQVGSPDYTVVAQASHDDVFYYTGNGNIPHSANGVDWYFSENYSMGFAPEGSGIRRRDCDVEEVQKEKRMCWHTNVWSGGYSCGAAQSLNNGKTWERIVLEAD